jgi:hypothetical protein
MQCVRGNVCVVITAPEGSILATVLPAVLPAAVTSISEPEPAILATETALAAVTEYPVSTLQTHAPALHVLMCMRCMC